jgi:hypothetical protein
MALFDDSGDFFDYGSEWGGIDPADHGFSGPSGGNADDYYNALPTGPAADPRNAPGAAQPGSPAGGFFGEGGFFGDPTGYIGRKAKSLANNPVSTLVNVIMGATPLGIPNTISGVLGGPTVGKGAQAIANSMFTKKEEGPGLGGVYESGAAPPAPPPPGFFESSDRGENKFVPPMLPPAPSMLPQAPVVAPPPAPPPAPPVQGFPGWQPWDRPFSPRLWG